METIKDRVKSLCNKNEISMNEVEKTLGFGKGYISKLGASTPNASKIKKIADFFGVSVDYLINGNVSQLGKNDELDIAKRLKDTLYDLEHSQDGLMFSGEPLDNETKELLKASLENSIRIAKINAKKFTPNKFKK